MTNEQHLGRYWPATDTIKLIGDLGVTREQLDRAQARAEDAGIHGHELHEIMCMLAQPPRDSIVQSNGQRITVYKETG